MSHIPTDLASDILRRLPVKTLLRFKCVAKAWGSLIDDPYFAKLHLDHSLETNTNVKLVLDNRKKADDKAYSVDFDSLNNLVQIDRPFLAAEFSIYCSRIFGSCNGLLAVYDRFKGFALWNPSTRKCRYLPPLDDVISRGHAIRPHKSYDYDNGCNDLLYKCYDYKDYLATVLGFGYDVISNDYKVVKMLESRTLNCYIVMLYSLKANAWRRIGDVLCSNFEREGDGVYINNSLHLGIYSGSSKSIFALDLGTEEYYEVPLPEDPKKGHQYRAGVLGRRLCVSRRYFLPRFECHRHCLSIPGAPQSFTAMVYVESLVSVD